MSEKTALDALVPLGFTDLEARIYVSLLRESPQTGYGIARSIGKATANTYKAIDALRAKGALLIDDGSSRMCRAVPAEELLGRMTRQFQQQASRASERLAGLGAPAGDERIYQLRDPAQVLERAGEMLRRAKRVALLDAFPNALEKLREDIADAVRRKVAVFAHVYEAAEIAGVVAVAAPAQDDIRKRWPGEQLNIVIDAEEHLLALLSHDLSRVHQAVWSQSLFLSCMQHNHLGCEIELVALRAAVSGRGAPTANERRKLVQIEKLRLSRVRLPGIVKLRAQVG